MRIIIKIGYDGPKQFESSFNPLSEELWCRGHVTKFLSSAGLALLAADVKVDV